MNLGIDILIIQDLINIVVGLRDHDGDLGDKQSMDLPQDGYMIAISAGVWRSGYSRCMQNRDFLGESN